MNILSKFLFAGLMFFLSVSTASAVSFGSFTLSNSNSGDGFVTGSYPNLTVSGADNGASANDTFYTATVTAGGSLAFDWNYVTNDCCGAGWDPAGYVLNGTKTQLSANVFGSPGTGNGSGSTSVLLNSGDIFGWYVYSPDSIQGRGNLTVTSVPEPETYGMMLVGLGLMGFMVRRRRNDQA